MHYYTHNIGDFAIETRGLTYEQIGVYITLLDRYASTEAPITDAFVSIAYQGASKCIAIALLNAFFVQQEDGWVHPRIAQSIKSYADLSEKRRLAAKQRGKSKASAEQMQSKISSNEVITNNHKPITNRKEINKENPAPSFRGIDPRGFDDDSHYDIPESMRPQLRPEDMIDFDPECGF